MKKTMYLFCIAVVLISIFLFSRRLIQLKKAGLMIGPASTSVSISAAAA